MQISDYQHIQALIARYAAIVDREGVDAIAVLFWQDAELDFNGEHKGIDAIRRCYAAWIENRREPVDNLRHLIYAPRIEIDGARAIATTYFDADGHSKATGEPIRIRGVYEDALERRGEEWRFAKRRIVRYDSP